MSYLEPFEVPDIVRRLSTAALGLMQFTRPLSVVMCSMQSCTMRKDLHFVMAVEHQHLPHVCVLMRLLVLSDCCWFVLFGLDKDAVSVCLHLS